MILAVGMMFAALASAQSLESAARELGRKIGVAARPRDINSLSVRNISSLSDAAAAQVRAALESELHVQPQQAGQEKVSAAVTLSENLQSYVWVAVVGADAIIQDVERPATVEPPPTAISIRKRFLWEQERPILDAAVSSAYLLVLDGAGLGFYRNGQLAQMLSVTPKSPFPRDLRGRLILEGDSFRVLLPEIVCNGSVTPGPAMVCADNSAWPLAAGRNYFVEPGLAPYFSSALLPGGRLLAGIDGAVRFYDASLRELGERTGWGSDIAAVDIGCNAGPGVLASKPGDATEPDEVRIYTIAGGEAAPVGEPALFPGPVITLWSSSQRGEAVAVARNSETGRYAAYSLAIRCDR